MPTSVLDPAAVAAFWEAIESTSATFVVDMFNSEGHQPTDEFLTVVDHLQRVHPDLLLTLGSSTTRPELVISAGGLRQAFPAVHELVAAAPAAVKERYDVRGFRPRVPEPTGLRIKIKGKELSPADIHWQATPRGRGRCDLVVYIHGFIDAFPADSLANRPCAEATFLLLDHLVGEWAVEAQIAAIDWRSPAKAPPGCSDLTALPDYLDRLSAE